MQALPSWKLHVLSSNDEILARLSSQSIDLSFFLKKSGKLNSSLNETSAYMFLRVNCGKENGVWITSVLLESPIALWAVSHYLAVFSSKRASSFRMASLIEPTASDEKLNPFTNNDSSPTSCLFDFDRSLLGILGKSSARASSTGNTQHDKATLSKRSSFKFQLFW